MARKGSSLDAFLEYFPSRRAILNRHFDGESPSRIDASLGLARGDARRAITDFGTVAALWCVVPAVALATGRQIA